MAPKTTQQTLRAFGFKTLTPEEAAEQRARLAIAERDGLAADVTPAQPPPPKRPRGRPRKNTEVQQGPQR